MKLELKRQHEKILVAVLAGMIMVGAAAIAVQPALADANSSIRTTATEVAVLYPQARPAQV